MATDDGPGVRTTIFFNKCPLNCIWCHNPESIPKQPQLQWIDRKCISCNSCVDACQESVLFFADDGLHINREKCTACGDCVEACPSTTLTMLGQWWDLDTLFHEIEKEKIFFDKAKGGITVSGGEPTIQHEFLLKLFKLCKENGISTALDTCGYSSKKVYQELLPYVDIVLLDIKVIDPKEHEEYCGVSNEVILENAKWMAEYVKENGIIMWIRTPIIPHYTATEENIKKIGQFIVNELHNIPDKWDLLSFNKLCEIKYSRLGISWILKDERLMTTEEMDNFLEIASN
ncbi:MAG: glycyl-radical enzyme activating protein, partial [Candidatus Hermodarchaeota archaeon]